MNIFQLIRNNEKLSSCYDTICLVGEKKAKTPNSNFSKENDICYLFKVQHPSVINCNQKVECGFIIQE